MMDELTTDVVVIGSGGAGLRAAVAAGIRLLYQDLNDRAQAA